MIKRILFKHFSNGFVIWSYVLFGFGFVKEVEPIALFRTTLWVDQTMWVFLIPMLIQSWFSISTGIKIKNIEFHNIKDNILFPLVIAGSVALIFVSYSFFVWDVLSIIPADEPKAWANEEIDFRTFSYLMLIGSHINSGAIILFSRVEKYYIKKYSIKEKNLWPKKLESKVILMIFSFVIPLIIFVVYNCILEPRFLV